VADTVRGDFPDSICADCGAKGCVFKHWGPLVVPFGERASFCGACFSTRHEDRNFGRSMRPLGTLSMLTALDIAERELPKILSPENDKEWGTLSVNYHPPFVKRVFAYWNWWRISLHKIYPCKDGEALFHPHPWPSAMRIFSGRYEMAVGFGSGDTQPPFAAKLILPAPARYEMTHRDAWHYVRPLDEPAFSLLVTGTPWQRSSPKGEKLQPLEDSEKKEILEFFRSYYRKAT